MATPDFSQRHSAHREVQACHGFVMPRVVALQLLYPGA
jgi:hypothetical protein